MGQGVGRAWGVRFVSAQWGAQSADPPPKERAGNGSPRPPPWPPAIDRTPRGEDEGRCVRRPDRYTPMDTGLRRWTRGGFWKQRKGQTLRVQSPAEDSGKGAGRCGENGAPRVIQEAFREPTSERQRGSSGVPGFLLPKTWRIRVSSAANSSREVTMPSTVGLRTTQAEAT